jgi:hypothetical protein
VEEVGTGQAKRKKSVCSPKNCLQGKNECVQQLLRRQKKLGRLARWGWDELAQRESGFSQRVRLQRDSGDIVR